MRVLIVGGVAGGASAAARLRRLDEHAEIVLFERGDYISFANCGLPYYIGGVIREREKLLVVTPDQMAKRFNIDVRTGCEVKSIDREKKTVTVFDKNNNHTYTEAYDRLVLSPGASPLRPPLPGINHSRVFSLRSIPDTDAIKAALDSGTVKRAVVVGGGFIGLEMVENLHRLGLHVALVELLDQVMAPLDFEMAALVHQHLKTKGVALFLGDGLAAITDRDGALEVALGSGRKLETDMVLLAIGVRPEVDLAKGCGLAVNRGIVVDEAMRTSDPDILAVGDAVEVRDYTTGGQALVPLAWPANKQGRIAADVIAGRDSRYKGSQGTAIAQVFDMVAAASGNNAKQLQDKNIPFLSSITHSAHHAGYYPGAIPLTIKLLFAPADGKLLGAQVVGIQGVDKRADVLAVAIRAGMSVHDLEELELAYAPPFSSAKDPAIMAGFVAANQLKGDVAVLHWNGVEEARRSGDCLLDVRTADEHALGTIPGALNIPIDELRKRLKEVPHDRRISVFCQIGLRGYLACRILAAAGHQCRNLSGGYTTWHHATVPQSNLDAYESVRVSQSDQIVATRGETVSEGGADHRVDACGLQCPGPVLQLFAKIQAMETGEVVDVAATDPGFSIDIKSWCERTGHPLLALETRDGTIHARIRKGAPQAAAATSAGAASRDKTIVMFSGDFDKAMATFIIANTAASMGGKVTVFFTFWGLNLLRRHKASRVKKTLIERMFGWMMPRGSRKFKLSRMNMLGMGTKMIRGIMKKKHVASLEELVTTALANGVRLVACQMTMDLMGIKPGELIEGVEFGGAASYLGAAEQGNVNLFI